MTWVFFFPHSPLHLAIIHQQPAVTQQLIQTVLSSHQPGVLNTANHLLQVDAPRATRQHVHVADGLTPVCRRRSTWP